VEEEGWGRVGKKWGGLRRSASKTNSWLRLSPLFSSTSLIVTLESIDSVTLQCRVR